MPHVWICRCCEKELYLPEERLKHQCRPGHNRLFDEFVDNSGISREEIVQTVRRRGDPRIVIERIVTTEITPLKTAD